MAESIWSSIADHHHINVRLHRSMPDGCEGALVRMPDGEVWILIDAHLPAHERRAVLAHELEHLRRGSVRFDGAPASWDAVIAREELAVDRAVAHRLVPLDELRSFVAQASTLDQPVTALDVALEFDVPLWVARHACEQAA